MNSAFLLYNLLVVSAALLAFGLACYAAGRSVQHGGWVFMLLMLALAEWSFCYVFANLVVGPTRLFWLAAAYIGVAFTGPLWLLFALLSTHRFERLPRGVALGIGLLGMFSLSAVLANSAFALAWSGRGDISSPEGVYGPLFWVHTVIAYSTTLVGMGLYARAFLNARSPYREQAALMLVGALLPLIVNAAYLAGLKFWLDTDLTPIALALSGLVFSYTIGRYRLLPLSPIARQVVLDSMGDGLIVVDMDGVIVEYNPAAQALASLVAPAGGREIAAATADPALGAALAEMLASSSDTRHERTVAAQADQGRLLYVTHTPLIGERAQHLGALFMLRDITRRVRAEDALNRRVSDLTLLHQVASAVGTTLEIQDLLRVIATTTRDALGVTSALVALNDDTGAYLTIAAESVRGDGDSLIKKRVSLTEGVIADLLRAEAPLVSADVQRDERLIFLQGVFLRRHTHVLLVAPLRAGQRLIGALCLESAVPRQFSAEELALTQMIGGYAAAAIANAQLFDAAQAANRLKSSILDTVSHEFRTPITAILGFTELYQEHVFGPVTDEQQEALDAVQRGAHRLLKLVDDLLDMARLEAGKLDLELHPIEVRLCLHEVAAMIGPLCRQKSLELRLEIADNLAPALADPIWLRRVLMNLLNNAVKFTEVGQVTMRAYEVDSLPREGRSNIAEIDRRRLVLEVEDTGVGVDQLDQELIFDAFRRGPNTRTSIAGGSGLGLAISKRVIEQMKGQLTVHSQSGRGSTFSITLRVAELALEHP